METGCSRPSPARNVLNPVNDINTTYSYDAAGRVVKTQENTTFGSCVASFTVYDPAGNPVAALCNYDPGVSPDPTTVAQALALFNPALPDKNRVTTFEYDTMGRLVKQTVDAGAPYALVTLTAYDGLNRVVRTITNYVASTSINDPCVRLFPHRLYRF